jgi:glucose/mannose transport system substrate-binding protein
VPGGRPPPAPRNPPRARRERTLAVHDRRGRRGRRGQRVRQQLADKRHGEHESTRRRVVVDFEIRIDGPQRLVRRLPQVNPGVRATNGAVAGGAGSNAIVELAKRLQRNDPPDVWQTFAGKSVQGYANRGVIRSVASIFARERLKATMNPTILKALMHDGRPYGVPTGAHRSNVLWFNTKLLERARVAPPSSGYTVDSFISDLRKIKASGAAPLCLGAKDRFTTVELFENTLLSSIGPRGWQHMVHNGLDWRSKQVQTALKTFGAILRYADPEASRLTWDQATKKLAAGGCAFESMNDSAFGELTADGAHEGTEFGAVPFPGTEGSFLAVVDVFVAATEAKNAKNALAFLSGIDDPATQLAFSKAKGSIPVVQDVDVSSLPAYQRASSKAFWASPVLLSIAHGEGLSPDFQEAFYDAVSTYVRTRDPGAFADDLYKWAAQSTSHNADLRGPLGLNALVSANRAQRTTTPRQRRSTTCRSCVRCPAPRPNPRPSRLVSLGGRRRRHRRGRRRAGRQPAASHGAPAPIRAETTSNGALEHNRPSWGVWI